VAPGWRRKTGTNSWITAERITLKDFYTKDDLAGMEHLGYAAGLPPFLRGPYSAMYTVQPWTIRQYAGFSTAEESNAFYRRNLAAGQKGMSVAFDLPLTGDMTAIMNAWLVMWGKPGAIDSVLDMKILFDQIPLNKMSVSMTMNGAVLPIMAFYIVTALEQGARLDERQGQFRMISSRVHGPEYIYLSSRFFDEDHCRYFRYTSENMPKFNSISISGYHMRRQEHHATLNLLILWPTALISESRN
jgi:methylmalonyl-CoA mutase